MPSAAWLFPARSTLSDPQPMCLLGHYCHMAPWEGASRLRVAPAPCRCRPRTCTCPTLLQLSSRLLAHPNELNPMLRLGSSARFMCRRVIKLFETSEDLCLVQAVLR